MLDAGGPKREKRSRHIQTLPRMNYYLSSIIKKFCPQPNFMCFYVVVRVRIDFLLFLLNCLTSTPTEKFVAKTGVEKKK